MATFETTLSEDVKENILQNLRNVYPGLLPSAMKNVLNSEGWDLKKSLDILAALDAGSSQKKVGDSPTPSTTTVNGTKKVKAEKPGAVASPSQTTKPTKRPLFKANKTQGDAQESGDLYESKESRKKNLAQNLEIIKQFKDPIDRIYACHREGIKILILMRGCPGSGKTSCARELLSNLTDLNFDHHIVSADDYFIVPETGKYHFDAEYIAQAHEWVKAVLKQLVGEGRSPLIVDNTHSRLWEMSTSASLGVENGYVVETLEPRTPWFFTEDQLVVRNTHGVHKEAIRRMLMRYEPNIGGPELIRKLQLSYKNVLPPQKRIASFDAAPTKAYVKLLNSRLYSSRVSAPMRLPKPDTVPLVESFMKPETVGKSEQKSKPTFVNSFQPKLSVETVVPRKMESAYLDVGAVASSEVVTSKEYVVVTDDVEQELVFQFEKPAEVPRSLQEFRSSSAAYANFKNETVPTIVDSQPPMSFLGRTAKQDTLISFLQDSATNTHYLDFEALNMAIPGHENVLIGVGNRFQSYPALPDFSVPTTLTLEKSSMTVDVDVNEKVGRLHGIERLVKMFPGAAHEGLEELFDRCQGNLDWVVNVLLDSGQELSEEFRGDDDEDWLKQSAVQESEPPPPPPPPLQPSDTVEETSSAMPSSPLTGFQEGGKKVKKSKLKTTEGSEELAKRLAESFVLSDSCYSERLKKVRETKYGIVSAASTTDADQKDEETEATEEEEEEEDVTVIMNGSAIKSLQKKFGDATLNSSIIDDDVIVRLPLNLARQLYSYAVESIYNQMEEREHVMDTLFKEDEDLARKLQGNYLDERPLSFKEIVDKELAIQMSKNGSSSGGGAPTMAGALSKKLLIERFPTMDPASLNKILEDTNHSLHQATFLLTSAGHSPAEADTVTKPQQDEPRMSREESIKQADAYSDVSSKLHDLRRDCLKKAEQAYFTGNRAVAVFYSDMAKWYIEKIKESNSKAARAMLSGVEGTNTLDLHFLLVIEAIQVLDLYLDDNIRRLRDGNLRRMIAFIITGRGAHSINGKSRLKPVVQYKLNRRKIKFEEQNPGMLKAVISKKSLMSYEINEHESKT